MEKPGRSLILPQNLDTFFGNIVQLLANYIKENYDTSVPVSTYLAPDELRKVLDFNLHEKGVGLDGILDDLKKTLKYSTRTGHIRFFNQLWAGSDIAAIIAEWFLSVLNTSMYTYEVAPVFTLMEMTLIDRFCALVGYSDGEGTFAPGGAHANYLGMIAARQHTVPHVKKKGLGSHRLVCFVSLHSHYTIPRGCALMGIGTEGCIYVAVDEQGRMKPDDLEAKIKKAKEDGFTPFLVNATAGTTVYGAFDLFEEIAEVCQRNGNIWLHIDACWGGHCIFSEKYAHLMKGKEKADSISLTGTKCFGLPQQCALIVLKKKGQLRSCNAMGADYLFHEYEEKNYDLGDLTLNCGRRVDSFKLWVAWKVYGDQGMRERVEHAFDQAKYCVDIINRSNGVFELAHSPQSLNVCFWYVPEAFRNQKRSQERDLVLDKTTSLIRRRIQLEGKVLTNFADVPSQPHFFRHITCNPGASGQDMDEVFAQIKAVGDSLQTNVF